MVILERERERERAQLDVAKLVRLPNGDHEVMGLTRTFIPQWHLVNMYEVSNKEVRELTFKLMTCA